MALELNLKKYTPELRLKKEKGREYVWDPSRSRYLVLQPEEFVRQLLMQYLRHEHGIPFSRMRSEQSIKLHSTAKRCDLVVYDKRGKPWLLAECKSFKKMDPGMTADQIERYNLEVNTDRILITNGPQSIYFQRENPDSPFKRLESLDLSNFS
jgi:hypothetical protein